MAETQDNDKNIEMWKIEKLMETLDAARGNGTSMVSLIIPAGDQIARATEMLAEEYVIASRIKSRVNRKYLQDAINSAQRELESYSEVPPNGLVLYTGTIATDDGKEKEVTFKFAPYKPINTPLFLCDDWFEWEPLNELLEYDEKFGFIVMDGNGTLFGTLSGNTREVLHTFTVDLQMEDRHEYVRKAAEMATKFYINLTNSVSGLILAGSADFKTELSQSDHMFDPRLRAKILNVVDVSCGGEKGFNRAIELSAWNLSNAKFILEKRLIGKFFEEIGKSFEEMGRKKYVFGVDDTVKALEMRAVETLIVWEDLDINRYVLKNSVSGETVIKYLNEDEEKDEGNFKDSTTAAELEVQEEMSLPEWFANVYRKFGCALEFVTNGSREGSQFCKGFGGIGGLLRYQLDMPTFD